MESPGETQPRVSREFLLGILKAALRPERIEMSEVKKVLLAAQAMGYDPTKLYLEAVEDRPEAYAPPPLLKQVLPSDLPLEKQYDSALGVVLQKRKAATQGLSSASKPSTKKD
jgi:hypothetical protein